MNHKHTGILLHKLCSSTPWTRTLTDHNRRDIIPQLTKSDQFFVCFEFTNNELQRFIYRSVLNRLNHSSIAICFCLTRSFRSFLRNAQVPRGIRTTKWVNLICDSVEHAAIIPDRQTDDAVIPDRLDESETHNRKEISPLVILRNNGLELKIFYFILSINYPTVLHQKRQNSAKNKSWNHTALSTESTLNWRTNNIKISVHLTL